MVKEAYCSKKVSELLREKGFLTDIDLRITQNLSFYDDIGLRHNLNKYYNSLIQDKIAFVVAPTHQMSMAWLREVHNLCISIYYLFPYGYTVDILYTDKDTHFTEFRKIRNNQYDSYEEAVEAALKYTLENLI